ncbi:MAG: helix-turn-helix domain-containing protein [Bacilli bacterium]|nr:helix-turn-helix domain-containing protein [Bacilli bacterium]
MIKYIWEVIFVYSNELVCNILKYINININTEITIINLSNIFSYDKTYIMKKFKRELGLTIIEYINNKRILNSLNGYKSNTTILRIALLNGYNSIEYYSEIFRNLVGVSPRVYKRFITPLNNLNEEETNTIRNSISNLINIENKIQKYLSNQKPKELPVRKLSIFK